MFVHFTDHSRLPLRPGGGWWPVRRGHGRHGLHVHDDAEHVRYDGPASGTHDDAPRHDDGRWKEEEDEGLNCADTLGKSKVTTNMIFLLSTPYPSHHDTNNSSSHLPFSYLS